MHPVPPWQTPRLAIIFWLLSQPLFPDPVLLTVHRLIIKLPGVPASKKVCLYSLCEDLCTP
jgi:hypothetical protein